MLGGRATIEAVGPTNLHLAVRLVAAQCVEASDSAAPSEVPAQVKQRVQRLVQDAITVDATED
ncbi:hypothetical protein [Verminephrobacter eiseniae]|uniref:hypothetical protein n=1 Tax=Verminephrobacter eiseniae TaxID=364317 RepID=UPI0022370E19|nr:hypothetical protein [Verminephrobacter eiseniae]